jgi:hypothetical protein
MNSSGFGTPRVVLFDHDKSMMPSESTESRRPQDSIVFLDESKVPVQQNSEIRNRLHSVLDSKTFMQPLEYALNLLQISLTRSDWNAVTLALMSFLLLNLQACNIMHQPRFDEENGFRESEYEIDDAEEETRRKKMDELLENPKNTQNLALLTGIEDEQKESILESFEDLFETVERQDFDEYLEVCREAKEKLGIMCFNRYPPQLLQEVVRNFNDPEYNSEKPAVIVIIDRDDHTRFGIYPLSVESYQVGKLPEFYKVFLFECSSVTEVLFQINRLMNEEKLQRGKLESIVVGSHGTDVKSSTGIQFENIPALSRFMEYANPDQMTLVLANCYSGEGRENGDNIVNRLALAAGRNYKGDLKVVGADTFLAGVELQTRSNGEVQSLDFQSLIGRLTGGIFNITYTADRDRVFPPYYRRLRALCSPTIPNQFINSAVGYGICDPVFIHQLHESNVTPAEYIAYLEDLSRLNISISQELALQSLEKLIPPYVVQQFVANRSYKNIKTIKLQDIRFFEAGITPQLIANYREEIPEMLHSDIIALKQNMVFPSDLKILKKAGLMFEVPELIEITSAPHNCTIDRLFRFTLLGVYEIAHIRTLMDSGMSESTLDAHHASGRNINQMALSFAKER